jgi:hypothetical protein
LQPVSFDQDFFFLQIRSLQEHNFLFPIDQQARVSRIWQDRSLANNKRKKKGRNALPRRATLASDPRRAPRSSAGVGR